MAGVKQQKEGQEELSKLDQEIAEITAKWGKDNVSHIVFEDGKQVLLSKPDRKIVALARSRNAQKDLANVDVIFENCWLAGDEEIKDSIGHILGLEAMLNKIVGVVICDLKNS